MLSITKEEFLDKTGVIPKVFEKDTAYLVNLDNVVSFDPLTVKSEDKIYKLKTL